MKLTLLAISFLVSTTAFAKNKQARKPSSSCAPMLEYLKGNKFTDCKGTVDGKEQEGFSLRLMVQQGVRVEMGGKSQKAMFYTVLLDPVDTGADHFMFNDGFDSSVAGMVGTKPTPKTCQADSFTFTTARTSGTLTKTAEGLDFKLKAPDTKISGHCIANEQNDAN